MMICLIIEIIAIIDTILMIFLIIITTMITEIIIEEIITRQLLLSPSIMRKRLKVEKSQMSKKQRYLAKYSLWRDESKTLFYEFKG